MNNSANILISISNSITASFDPSKGTIKQLIRLINEYRDISQQSKKNARILIRKIKALQRKDANFDYLVNEEKGYLGSLTTWLHSSGSKANKYLNISEKIINRYIEQLPVDSPILWECWGGINTRLNIHSANKAFQILSQHREQLKPKDRNGWIKVFFNNCISTNIFMDISANTWKPLEILESYDHEIAQDKKTTWITTLFYNCSKFNNFGNIYDPGSALKILDKYSDQLGYAERTKCITKLFNNCIHVNQNGYICNPNLALAVINKHGDKLDNNIKQNCIKTFVQNCKNIKTNDGRNTKQVVTEILNGNKQLLIH